MGCGESKIVSLEYLPEDSEYFIESRIEYNKICEEGQRIGREYYEISMKNESLIYQFFPEAVSTPDFGKCIIEGYLKFILSVIHYLYKIKQVPQPLTFSNYLPGIIIDRSLFESTTDGCEEPLLVKYDILKQITINLPGFIDNFERLSQEMIDIVIALRDTFPKRFYEESLKLPGISCVIPFSKIEVVLIRNIEIIAKPAIQFEQVFKNIRVYINKIQEIIEKCHQRFSDFKKILDGIDKWDYSQPNEEIDRRLSKFFKDLNFAPEGSS